MYKASPLYGVVIKGGSNGVEIQNLRPEILQALSIARTVFISFREPITVTDAWRNDPNSLHYYNLAVDLRAKHLTSRKRSSILRALKEALGEAYQVILHGSGDGIHYHIEYDPLRTGVREFKTT